jgi:hypothetical protein
MRHQSLRAVKRAAPRFTQCFAVCSFAMGRDIDMTKFVLCPVVESRPARSEVL